MAPRGCRVRFITLLTDFGTADAYAAVLHGVILRINPQAVVVDLCHDIAPQDVQAAAFVLSTAYPYFPTDTVHVAVVDPGVGSARRALGVATNRGTFVAPDNGLLHYVLGCEPAARIVHLTEPRYWLTPTSQTFHGCDMFAPVAAHLSLGVALQQMGAPVSDAVRLGIPEARRESDGSLCGQVVHVDRFGNCITNVPGAWLTASQCWKVRLAGMDVEGPLPHYAAASGRAPLALVGSHGYLEIAVRDGSAAAALSCGRGAEVRLEPLGASGCFES